MCYHISKVLQPTTNKKINVFLKCVFYLKSAIVSKAVVLMVGSGCLRLVIFGVTSLLVVKLLLVLYHDCCPR